MWYLNRGGLLIEVVAPAGLTVYTSSSEDQGLSRNASSVSFGHAEHCFLTVWTPKSLCQNLLKMAFLRR